jgi:hypothetical protein
LVEPTADVAVNPGEPVVYALVNDRVSKVTVGPPASEEVIAVGQTFAYAIAVDATHAYWTTHVDDGAVFRAPIATVDAGPSAPPTRLASGQGKPGALVIDATSVYWVDESGGALRRCPKEGCGEAPITLASDQHGVSAIAVDDAKVYWTNRERHAVMAVAKR